MATPLFLHPLHVLQYTQQDQQMLFEQCKHSFGSFQHQFLRAFLQYQTQGFCRSSLQALDDHLDVPPAIPLVQYPGASH